LHHASCITLRIIKYLKVAIIFNFAKFKLSWKLHKSNKNSINETGRGITQYHSAPLACSNEENRGANIKAQVNNQIFIRICDLIFQNKKNKNKNKQKKQKNGNFNFSISNPFARDFFFFILLLKIFIQLLNSLLL
jgi:hypothetical protein